MFNQLNLGVMKTKNFKKIAAVLFMAVWSVGAFAQPAYVTDAERDTVALGSKARYKTTLNLHAIAGVMADSRIIWTFPAGYTRVPDVFQIDGTTQLPAADGNGAYADTEIVIVTKAVASGLSLTAAERSYPSIGVGCVDATPEAMTIDVVAMPTMGDYGADSGGCASPATLMVPATFSGYGKYDVRLNVAAYTLSGTGIGAAQNEDLTDQLNVRTSEAGGSHRLAIPLATLQTAAGGAIPAAGCYFVITATNLQDRISKKHLGYVFNTTNVANANPDGAFDYRFFIYPVPITQPIQHIQNMY